jgi:hypothetical protein
VSSNDEKRAWEVLQSLADASLMQVVRDRYTRPFARHHSLPTVSRNPRNHLDPRDWYTGFLQADREVERPGQLVSDLNEVVPQALLRDLYRPVMESRWLEREPQMEPLDRAGLDGTRVARAARTLAPLPRITSLTVEVAAEQRRRRALLAETWKPLLRDDEPRRKIDFHH